MCSFFEDLVYNGGVWYCQWNEQRASGWGFALAGGMTGSPSGGGAGGSLGGQGGSGPRGVGPGPTGHERVPHNPCQQSGYAPRPGWYASQMQSIDASALSVAAQGNYGTGAMIMAFGIAQWRRGALLDGQPLGASRAYANYVYGVGFAAAGFSLSFTLWGANAYASASHATYSPAAGPMDATYNSLPTANVQNITRGYNAYMNGTTCGR